MRDVECKIFSWRERLASESDTGLSDFLDSNLTNSRSSHSNILNCSLTQMEILLKLILKLPRSYSRHLHFALVNPKWIHGEGLEKRYSLQELGKHKSLLCQWDWNTSSFGEIQNWIIAKKLNLTKLTFVSGLSPVAVKRYCQSGRPRCTIIILKYSVKQEARYHHSSERSRNHISGWLVVTPKS